MEIVSVIAALAPRLAAFFFGREVSSSLQARQPYASQTAANEVRARLATASYCAFNVAVNEVALRELQEADRSFHLHPFTNHFEMHGQGTQVIVSADGCYLTGCDGPTAAGWLGGALVRE